MPLILFFLLISFFSLPFETFSDGVDFSIASASLGLPHPPSYPLFVILSRLFYSLPFGNPAFRLSLFSAFTTAVLLYVIWRLYDAGILERIFFCFFVLLCKTFLANSVTGEVYSLNLLFFAVIFFLSEKIENKKFFYLSAFLLGLGIGNHHTLLFLAVYLIIEATKHRESLSSRDWMVSLFFLILGLSVYMYLPFRAICNPQWNWGNPVNYKLFWTSFMRADFAPSEFMRDFQTIFAQLKTFNPFRETGVVNAVFAMAAIILMAVKDNRKFLKLILLIFMYSYLVIILLGDDNKLPKDMAETYSAFFIPAYFVIGYISAQTIREIPSAYKFFVTAFLVVALFYNAKDSIKELKLYERDNFYHDYSKADRNAALIVAGNEEDFPVFYQQKIGRFREDVRVIPLATLGKKWNLRESLDAGATYVKGYHGESDEKKMILKGVISYQKDFLKRRVFTNFFDKDHLPMSIEWALNGLFWEYPGGEALPIDFIRTRGGKELCLPILEDIVYSNILDNIEKGRIEDAEKALEIFMKISADEATVKKLKQKINRSKKAENNRP
jgi:hypothetical protein